MIEPKLTRTLCKYRQTVAVNHCCSAVVGSATVVTIHAIDLAQL